jgi:hypothetical protein
MELQDRNYDARSVASGFMLRYRSARMPSTGCITRSHNNHIKFAPFGRRTPAAQVPLMKGRYVA